MSEIIPVAFSRRHLSELYDVIVNAILEHNDSREPGAAISRAEVIGTLELVKQYFMQPENQ